MFALSKDLQNLIKRAAQEEPTALDALVKETLEQTKGKLSAENRKSQWEFLIKEDIFNLAVRVELAIRVSTSLKMALHRPPRMPRSRTRTQTTTRS